MVSSDHTSKKRQPKPVTSLRERNKAAKLRRIEQAGRRLFARLGFDQTTVREIARKADVGGGTFFLYFAEKRDLLLHLFKKDVGAVQAHTFATLPEAGLSEQLGYVFASFYDFYAKDQALSRTYVKELMFLDLHQQPDLLGMTLELIVAFSRLVALAKERGEVDAAVEEVPAGMAIFTDYGMGLMAWLNGTIPTRELLDIHIQSQLRLLFTGLLPRPTTGDK